jgi:hypothetical protein
VTPGGTAPSPDGASGGPVNALQFAKDHPNVPYDWSGTTVDGADCSGWVGLLQQVAQGVANPTGRLGTTLDVIGGTWPQLVNGASASDAFIIGANADHMVASILGTNVEARQTGENVRIGSAASSPFDSQFTTVGHVDPAAFVPSFVAGSGSGGSGGSGGGDGTGSGLDSETDGVANQDVGTGTDSNEPKSFSDIAGIAAQAAAKGYVQDTLKVFGIPDNPPILGAISDYRKKKEEEAKNSDSNADSDKGPTSAGTGNGGPTPPPTKSSTTDPAAGLTPNQQNPFAHTYDPSGGVDQWRGVVEAVLKLGGWPASDLEPTLGQMKIESGGDPEAHGPADPVYGDPFGLMQVKPPTFDSQKSSQLVDSITDPANNIFAGLGWVYERWGGASQKWPTTAGYATGGSVWGPGGPTDDLIPAWLSDREFVMNAKSADHNRPLLEAMNRDANALDSVLAPRGVLAASRSAGGAGGPSNHVDQSMTVNLSTPDVDTAYQKAKQWETARGLTYTGRWG